MSVLGQPTWATLTELKLRFGYSGMGFRIRVNIHGSGTRISGYPLRSLIINQVLVLKIMDGSLKKQ